MRSMVEGPVPWTRRPLGPATTAFGGGSPPRSGEELGAPDLAQHAAHRHLAEPRLDPLSRPRVVHARHRP